MMHEQYLILGQMPKSATSQSHLAVGPWCFVGVEEFFPAWEDSFTFAPEPLRDKDALEVAVRQAQRLVAQHIAPLALHVRPKGEALPPVYWETVFGPWLIMVTQQVVERWMRVQAMVAEWGHMPLRVPVLPPECTFTFGDDHDFVLGGALGHTYNHWLLSRLLEEVWPPAWEKVVLPPVHERHCNADVPLDWKEKLQEKARQLLLRLPFPLIKGFSFSQMLRFSLALRANGNVEDNSRSLAEFDVSPQELPDLDMPCVLFPLLCASMPQSIRRGRHPHSLRPAARPRVRVASVAAYEDTDYRLRLARWRGMGHKLVYIQHGGNYGHVRSSAMASVVEYTQHAFITWGWTSQSPQKGNFIPLPHGQLARLRNAHRATSGQLLFVGAEITVVPYRMDSRLTPLQNVQYRDDKQWFFEALSRDMQKKCLYRPYFAVPGALADAEWLLPRFPLVHLCSGPLDPHMLSCRLLVLDHHGTTLELAMAANVPMVLFWDRALWGLCPETEKALDVLAQAGIWQPTAESAAMHIQHIWKDVPGWWASAPVQEARALWMRQYALTVDDSIESSWVKTLKTV